MTATIEAQINQATIQHSLPREEAPFVFEPQEREVNREEVAQSRREQARVLEKNGLGMNGRMQRLTNEFIGIVSENGITTFHNGDKKQSFVDSGPKQDLRIDVTNVIWNNCKDFFDEWGNIKKGKEGEWGNVEAIAPNIAAAFLSKENGIKSVNRDQTKDIFDFAVKVALDPSLLERTVVSIGFGGSADSATSSRLPSYGLPAQLIAEQINRFYQDRLIQGIDEARKAKYPTITDEKKLPYITDEELGNVKKRYAIPDKPLTLRFFSGAEAGIESNFPDRADAVRKRREENWDAIEDFTNMHFPDLLPQMTFENDIPAEEYSIEQKTVLEYGAHILRTSKRESIKSTLTFLEGLGKKKGGEQGKELAAEYAFRHTGFFKDRLNLPAAYTNFFDVEHVFEKPEVAIMIGGRSEEMFSGIRDYLVEHVTPEGLRDYARTKAVREELALISLDREQQDRTLTAAEIYERARRVHEISKLQNMATKMNRWIDAIAKRRETYAKPDPRIAPSDRTSTMVTLISTTDIAPYYNGPGDQPYGTDIAGQIADIKSTDLIPKEPEFAGEAKSAEIYMKAVLKDLVRLEKVTSKAA